MLGLEFPEINEVVRWVDLFPTFNKIAMIACAATIIGTTIFLLAARKDPLVAPTGVRNLAEIVVEFIEGLIMETIGKDGLKWTPHMLSFFIFIYLCNVPGIIPIIYMPATARMAIPFFLAIVVWVMYNAVGFKHQKLGYLTHMLWPPGVPVAMKPLVGLIEFVSNILLRPFALMIRLFANMLAGHMLLVTFAILTEALVQSDTVILKPLAVLPFFMLVFVTAFEVLVQFLQAYIFTILACVYIGLSMAGHDEHEEHSDVVDLLTLDDGPGAHTRRSRRLIRSRRPSPDLPLTSTHRRKTPPWKHSPAWSPKTLSTPTTRRLPTRPSAPALRTAWRPSDPASASATSPARPSKRWPDSRRLPAWCAPRCSWASPSPRRSP